MVLRQFRRLLGGAGKQRVELRICLCGANKEHYGSQNGPTRRLLPLRFLILPLKLRLLLAPRQYIFKLGQCLRFRVLELNIPLLKYFAGPSWVEKFMVWHLPVLRL